MLRSANEVAVRAIMECDTDLEIEDLEHIILADRKSVVEECKRIAGHFFAAAVRGDIKDVSALFVSLDVILEPKGPTRMTAEQWRLSESGADTPQRRRAAEIVATLIEIGVLGHSEELDLHAFALIVGILEEEIDVPGWIPGFKIGDGT